ncbi:MAG: DNA-binding protein [Bdellovibrionales bacterium]
MQDHVFLTPQDVIKRWRGSHSVRTLSNWRSENKGPPVTKIGRVNLYRLDLLEKWEQENLKTAIKQKD